MDEIEALKSFGLSDREIKIYLALLSLGTSTVNKIAEKAGIIRTSTYDILKSLVEMGLASYVIRSGVKYFETANPEKSVAILDEKKRKMEEILPILNKIKERTIEKPKVEVYEGKEGLKSVLEDMLITKKGICGYSSMELLELLNFYFPHFIKRRAKLGIKTRILMKKSMQTEVLKLKDKEDLREIRFFREAKNFRLGYYIYSNKVAILVSNAEEPMGILIENDEFAEAENIIFEKLWSRSKE